MPPPRERRPSSLRILTAACFLSGAAALVYQVVWTRRLTLILGTTVAAVSTVLAAFMGGLGLGSAAAARADRLSRRVLPRLYAALEGGIAAYAVAFPLLLAAADTGLAGLYREGEPPSGLLAAARLAASAGLLLIPTLLMGATLPVLTALWDPVSDRSGRAAGLLYASNTLGAVAGSLAAAFFLIPGLGLSRASLLAAVLNAIAGGIVLAGGSREEQEPSPAIPTKTKPGEKKSKRAAGDPLETLPPEGALAIIALSGLGALADEVAWTRVLVLLIGPTTYAFAFIVAAVIAGLALGSAAASSWADRTRRPASALGLVQVGAALSSLALVAVVAGLPEKVGHLVRDNADRMARLMALEFGGVLVLLLGPCLFFGAAFPLAVSALARSLASPPAAVARAYAWNTAGAIAGSLLAGFAMLPAVGLQGTLLAAAGVHGLAGVLAFFLSKARGARLAGAAIATLLVAATVFAGRPWDPERMAGGAYKYAAYTGGRSLEEELRAGDLVYYREGATATVSVKRVGGVLSLAIDGKIDATSGGDMPTQRLLAHLPLLIHARPRRVLVIGLGSGVTAGSALTHPVEAVEAVEISPEVAEASALFRAHNGDALADPRLRLVIADGRNHLLRARRPYDVIISEPSNPWMAGVSSLFTRDFFLMARSRLAPGGLFCQWAHIYNMDNRDLRTVVGGFTDAFPEAALFLVNEGDLLLVGAGGGIPDLDPVSLERRMAVPAVGEDLAQVQARSPFLIASLYALGTPALAAWAADAPRHTDDRPVLEFRAPRFLHADTGQENHASIMEAARRSRRPEGWAALGRPPTASDVASRARMLEGAHSFGWALRTYAEALSAEPRLLVAHEGLARMALRTGAPEVAERELTRLAAGPAPVEARIGLALLYHNLERPAEARDQLQEALRREPANIRALLLAAEVEDVAGDTAAVEDLARLALAASPGHAEAGAFLALASLRHGQAAEALSRAREVLDREPGTTRALEVAAVARAFLGDRAGARTAFEALLAADPEGWGALNNYAVFEMEGKAYRSAARLFERAVDIHPGNLHGYRGLREAARALGDRRLLERAESGLSRLGGS